MGYSASRDLYWKELIGSDVCLLLEVRFAGKVWRWSTAPISISDSAGELRQFGGGLNELEYSSVLQTLADAPDQASLSFDLIWPDDVALLIAQGHDMSAGTGEVSAIVEGKLWSDRQVLLSGSIRQPEYGAAGEPVSFTVEEAPFQDAGSWPHQSEKIDATTWPTHQLGEEGLPYVQVFGRPGVYRTEEGAQVYANGSRAMVVETDPSDNTLASTLLIAGHPVISPTVRIYYMGADGWSPDEGLIDFVTLGIDYQGPVEFVPDGLGHYCSVVRIGTVVRDEIRRSAQFFVRWQGAGAGQNGGLWSDNESVNGLGSLLNYVLRQSTLRIDRGRLAAVKRRLNAWSVSGYVDEFVQPWEWVADNLLGLAPISIHSGRSGLYPVFWRWDAERYDAVDHIERDSGIERSSNIEYQSDLSEIYNSVQIQYAHDITDSEFKRAVSLAPSRDPDNPAQSVSEFSQRSGLLYGETRALEMQSNVITEDATANKTISWQVMAQGFSHRSVTYTLDQEYYALDLGDIVTLTDAEVHLDNEVCLVQGQALTDTGKITLTLQIVSNPAKIARTTGPAPDQGPADPGDYNQ
ncbi:MAG: phage tail protein [Alphaproteobacteria bacterium]